MGWYWDIRQQKNIERTAGNRSTCYNNRYVAVGIGEEKIINIRIMTKKNTIGKITNIHETIDAPFLHSKFNNQVQKKIKINWMVNIIVVLVTLQLNDPAQNVDVFPIFWNINTNTEIKEMTKYT